MRKLSVFLCVMLMFLAFAGMTNATLTNIGDGMIYDSDQDITWLQDANYAQTSGYDSDGLFTWAAAVAWADQLVYGGFSDWRLPTTPGTVHGYTTEGEMGHLFGVDGVNRNDQGVFDPTIRSGWYWTGEYGYLDTNAWCYEFSTGFQNRWVNVQFNDLPAWAVRDGGSAPVPEPATMLLLGSGLAGLGIFRRKIRRRHG